MSQTKIGSQMPRFSGRPRGLALAAVEHVGTAADRRWRPQPSRRSSAGPSGRCAGRVAAAGASGPWPGPCWVCAGWRPSDVLSSKPAISGSPLENGRWKTVPGGCTVMLATSGRRLRGRYAAVTDVRIGDGAPAAVSTARHCRYRALGLVICSPSAVRVGLRPGAPGLVRRRGVARAGEDLHLAGTRRHAPADHAPARDRSGVAHVGFVGAALRRGCGEREQLARIARRADRCARMARASAPSPDER